MACDPLCAQCSIERIQTLMGMGRLEEARQEAKDAVTRDAQEEHLWAALAMVEIQRRDFVAAVAAGERALSLNPENAIAMHELGMALYFTGRPSEARTMVDHLVAIQPEWASAYVQRASIYSYVATTETDRQIVRDDGAAALALRPDDTEVYDLIAAAHHRINDTPTAARLIDDGLRIDPTSEDLLLSRVRYNNLPFMMVVDSVRSVLSVNPMNMEGLRLLHSVIWHRLIFLTTWPSIAGALSATLAYSFFLGSDSEAVRGWPAILFITAATFFAFSSAATMVCAREFGKVFRDYPAALAGFLLAFLAMAATTVAMLLLLIIPLQDPEELSRALGVISITITALTAGEILMRIASSQLEKRTGIYADSPEGRINAKYATRGSRRGTGSRLIVVGLVVMGALVTPQTPDVAAIVAIAAALLATVLFKVGTAPGVQYRRWTPLWFPLGTLVFVVALVCVVLQLWGGLVVE